RSVFDEGHRELARVTLLELRHERVRPVVGDEVEAEPGGDRAERAEDRGVSDRVRDLTRVENDLALVFVPACASAARSLVRLRGAQLDRFYRHVVSLLTPFTLLPRGTGVNGTKVPVLLPHALHAHLLQHVPGDAETVQGRGELAHIRLAHRDRKGDV